MSSHPGAKHGLICARLIHALMKYLEQEDVGRILANNTEVVVSRSPDVICAPDVAYCSYRRLSREDRVPTTHLTEAPEVVFEVLTPGEHWKDVLESVERYHQAHVMLVYVVDPKRQNVIVFHPNQPEETLTTDENVVVPGILPGFTLSIAELFA